ncbi:MFS transporter, putative [Bodo saltans]|uniref:MFS transporter, putative n=1 Tax=Bodo saltans TaxID=75058 RepID=A0A0S4JA56_BODSA|nr:MFS transporter, putative [Bodo saltans]|eukprot:CUG87086.1 MFS transporter, putative [Bodo saltans]
MSSSDSLERARSLAKWLQLIMSMSCNTMAFSITPYFASDAKHDFFLGETQIGFVFASFPMGYMISCVCMSLANISHLKMSTLTLWIRGFVLAFVGFSVMFGLIPTIFSDSTDGTHHDIAVRYAAMFGSLRFLQGLTVSVLDVLVLLYITKLYPEQVSAVVGQKEACMGLGVVFGPPLGGGLYSVGGFKAPPMVTGAIVFSIATVTQIVLLRSKRLHELHELREVPLDLVKALAVGVAPIAGLANDERAALLLLSQPATHPRDKGRGVNIINATQSEDPSSRVLFSSSSQLVDDETAVQDAPSLAVETIDETQHPAIVDDPQHIAPVTVQNLINLFRRLPVYTTVGPCCISVLSIACFAFLESMVPLYALDTYGVQAWGIGITMGGAAIVYAAAAITIGIVLGSPSRKPLRPWVLAIAAIVLAFGMLLVAPSFHVIDMQAPNTIRHGYAVTTIGILICCSAMAVIAVVAVALLVDEARATSLVLVPTAAAVANFGMSLGGFIGPITGSALAEAFGFPIAFFSFSCGAVLLAAIFVSLVLVRKDRG